MTRISDSVLFSHLWGTEELRAVFDENGRVGAWLRVLEALATAQAAAGFIPQEIAPAIAAVDAEQLEMGEAAEMTRTSSHSMVGFIGALEKVLDPDVAQWVYYGTTVQDITDTATALAIREVVGVTWRDLWHMEGKLLELSRAHRDLVMSGRTHGQIGSPITFGLKVATWADEVRRHLQRLKEGSPRWLVGQLAGSVGTIGFMGEKGPDVRAQMCARLGLGDPGISWTSTRDRVGEFVQFLALVTTTLARIGDEVYELQRSEIGELSERSSRDAVGSITMPHKNNPEGAEHLTTLARMVRASAQVTVESGVQSHERDGRGWKAEWVSLPEACLLTGTALKLGRELVDGLAVDAEAMERNLHATNGYWATEAVLAALAPRVGKHAAQRILHQKIKSQTGDVSLAELVSGDAELRGLLPADEWERLLSSPDVGAARRMVDDTVARIEGERVGESGAFQ